MPPNVVHVATTMEQHPILGRVLVVLLAHQIFVRIQTCIATRHPKYVQIFPYQHVNIRMDSLKIHPVVPVGQTRVNIHQRPVFIAPKQKVIVENTHCACMEKVSNPTPSIVLVGRPIALTGSTPFVTNH